MRPSRTLTMPLLALTLVVVGSACSSSSKSSTTATTSATTAAPVTTAAAATNSVTIKNFEFKPNPGTVAAGATVTVKNSDTTTHTFTSDDKTSFDTKRISPGASATFVAPTKAGTYKYHCAIHQSMTATLVVQ
jgi:plastocyanin